MLTSTYLLSTDKRLRSHVIGILVALMVVAGSMAYEVRPGDTLTAIAANHGVTVKAILEANDIVNPDLIRAGQSIVIPGKDGEPPKVHVVAAGETLAEIAARYGSNAAAVAATNELSNPNLIRIGQKLKIPGASGSTSAGGGGDSATFHVVRAGETLAGIASRYGVSVEKLAEANGITDPSRIYIGTRLSLTGQSFVADSTDGGSATSHTVQAGDTLGSIARRYGIDVNELARTNGISNPNRIQIGQKLTISGGGWVCPVAGGSYVNDWGFPRSGERFHQGTDLMAPRGTEVLAPVGGQIKLVTGTVGGLQFYLSGDDGVTYIGTHMEAFGRSGRVEAGQVIGYVGDTGNARGGPPHLHFEMHPDDGEAVNPFPTLQKAGC
ncbi:MAG TPA: LysM peptidoglycan-binding domain-containing M23 family metallopeptidase [Acidimicrobiia bacterium]|nr:LysM peptidoglycan-binding domain-containing M23 family metallopeptidase [Acidimicrobiia bacterium]